MGRTAAVRSQADGKTRLVSTDSAGFPPLSGPRNEGLGTLGQQWHKREPVPSPRDMAVERRSGALSGCPETRRNRRHLIFETGELGGGHDVGDFCPARGSQPGAQAGRHALEKGKKMWVIALGCCKSTTYRPARSISELMKVLLFILIVLLILFIIVIFILIFLLSIGLHISRPLPGASTRRIGGLFPPCKGLLPISPYEYGTFWH